MLLAYTGKRSKDLPLFLPGVEKILLPAPFCRAISRIDHKFDLFRYKLASEYLPELIRQTKNSLSWEECCEKRALDLLKLDRERYYLSYSGGIDSTVAITAMLKHWPAAAKKRISIFLSHESIRENPSFYQNYLSDMHLISSFENISNKILKENALFITGELGDQLFGSDILAKGSELYGDESLFKSYKDFVIPYLEANRTLQTRENAQQVYEKLQPIVNEAPFEIKTTHDFFWWYNFSQKWQYVKFRFFEKESWDLNCHYGSHIQHFFDDVEFQKWSLLNHSLKIRDSWKSYKWAAKNYLYEFTSDPLQMNLMKVQSLKNNYFFTRKRIAVDENYQEMTYEDLKKYVRI